MDRNDNIKNQTDKLECEASADADVVTASEETEAAEAEAVEAEETETAEVEAAKAGVCEASESENAETDAGKNDKPADRRKKTHGRLSFIGGVAAGIVLCLAAAVLYRGYIYFPVGDNGEFLIKLPYYDALHGNNETGSLDAVDIVRKTDEITDLIDRNYL